MADQHNWSAIHNWLKHEYEAGHFQQPPAGNDRQSQASNQESDWKLGQRQAQRDWQFRHHYRWHWEMMWILLRWLNPLFQSRFQEIIDYGDGYRQTWKWLKERH
ncbi:hypothetical protein M3M39_04795 [Fructilactobacillus hinvesii]|uniref:Uncharacterized protein n=1 Tax=Fructilactobacillus hinvesii TaxID=2940300 RepID=A0ABY5BTX1_9LACO|nr:hypothetical protein [Fructilactobacillus hinvesii]USS87441.1 hypothetical protein M3M39_04795 [Fructilactobacillus hinvesii]